MVRTMKDLIFLCAFLYSLKLVFISQSLFAYVVVILLTIVFSIKYFRKSIETEKLVSEFRKKVSKQNKYFLEILNHDIKIPVIAQIRGLELLKKENFGKINKEQEYMLQQITHSCRCILNMIGMLESVNNFENNSYKLTYEKFNVADLIISCFEKLGNIAADKNITFSLNGQRDSWLVADKAEIKRVILSLLENSISYSSIGTRLEINLLANDSALNFSVAGMKFAYRNLLPDSYSPVGHNIGMHLCKKIIELHNGKFFTNTNNGFLNSFSFIIPKTPEIRENILIKTV